MDFVELVKQAGIVGAGGAGFPTHIKQNAKAEYFIVNAAECEPLIETDKYLCRTFATEIIAGIEAIAEHLGASKAVIALKGKYHAEIDALNAAISAKSSNVTIFEMPTFYPAGDEQIMVQMVTGRSVPERGLPLDVGTVVDNVGTVLEIYHALHGGTVIEKYLSVTGEVQDTIMVKVPIGTAITECIALAKPTLQEYAVILGGPMMGRILRTEEEIASAVVTKTTGNLLLLPKDHYLIQHAHRPVSRIKAQARSACIQCRMCTDLCPRYMIGHQMRPHFVMRNLYLEDSFQTEEDYVRALGDAVNCCGCGICEMFACPMQLSPRKVNDYVKGQLRQKGYQVPRNTNPVAREGLDYSRIPTGRLIARLDLCAYEDKHAHTCIDFMPETVFIPFQQHIGKPAIAVKQEGDSVSKGELIAEAAEGLSVNMHASVDGVITQVRANGICIRRKEG